MIAIVVVKEQEFKHFDIPQEVSNAVARVRSMTVHAYGLLQPGHMEWTQDGRLLVSEFGRGRVTDITKGGDFRESESFASGLLYPSGIVTNFEGDRIIVADAGRDAIYDITEGGRVDESKVVYDGIPAPYGMVFHQGELLATYSSGQENGLTRVSKGKSFLNEDLHTQGFPSGVSYHPYVLARSTGCGSWTAVAFGDDLLLTQTTYGSIYRVGGPAKFAHDTHPRFARGLNKPVGMIYNEKDGLLYVAESGSGTVRAIPNSDNIDARYLPPVVSGLIEPRCVRFAPDGSSMYVCDTSACCVWKINLG